ncbi:hypothetical protein [Halpernia frigidisoli]|uniref:HNH endonuclease n=1 Tax=Halpernia frigidisoli TaxID=1125876 RepID=A0A1I3IMN0_9FLAO|nr:hypothetical protein [Halpernia frigidisoli]SFI49087.1 hypothetical protein SAMN05443292_2694 [Halpernia frigidisoli]
MRKIKYPYKNDFEKQKFNNTYYNLIKLKLDEKKINFILKKIDKDYSLKKILISDFSELIIIQDKVRKSLQRKNLESFFKSGIKNKIKYTYETFQKSISGFFMDNGIDLQSCHYCNVDYVNTFEEHYQFSSTEEFISKAPKEVLGLVDEISDKTAKEIINKRLPNIIINDLKPLLGPRVYAKLFKLWNSSNLKNSANVDLKNIVIKRNHYTLDHVLPKNEFSFLSLSLYNLVPSCYSCNSKFKHIKEFTVNTELAKLCPTSDNFELDKLFKFKINFDVNDKDFEMKISQVKQIDDVEVKIENIHSEDGVDEFLEIFKIKSRYEFHKNISFDLIEKRKDYSNSQLIEIENIFAEKGIMIDTQTFKKQIFGSIIYEKQDTNAPFEKYKKDIATQLGLI